MLDMAAVKKRGVILAKILHMRRSNRRAVSKKSFQTISCWQRNPKGMRKAIGVNALFLRPGVCWFICAKLGVRT